MFTGMALFSATDATAKFLTDTMSPVQIVWSRQCGLLIGVLLVIMLRGVVILKSKQPTIQISRGVLATISATLFITAIAYVPLADAVAITFVAPFMVTILGALVLGEKVGIRRWTAVTIGFLATLIIIRPGMGIVHPAALLLIVAALAFAGRQILSRVLADGERTSTTVAYTAIVSWSLLLIPLPFFWQTPGSLQEIGLIALMATLAALGETFIIMALETAQAVVVAPVHYSLIIWGTLYGFLLFGQLPDGWTLIGALIIIMTGLYTIKRERLANSRAQ